MYYLIAAILLFAFIALYYKIVIPSNEPDFELMGLVGDKSLKLMTASKANESRSIRERGKGLSTKLISRRIKAAFAEIKRKVQSGQECYDFERWIYDNFYKLSQAIENQKKLLFGYTQLPHVGERPRIYSFLEMVVKASGGSYTKNQLKELTDTYCAVTPLTFAEICALKNVLEFCLLEYIAIFCSRAVVIGQKMRAAKRDASKNRVNLSQINYNSYVLGMEKFANPRQKQSFCELCSCAGLSLQQRVDNFYRQISTYAGSVQAAISNLHGLVYLDDNFVMSLSPLYQVFYKEPKGGFADCTIPTQFVYLYNVARRSKRKKISELAYARQVLDSANSKGVDIAELILPTNRSKAHMRIYVISLLLLASFLDFLVVFFLFSHIWWVSFLIFPCMCGLALTLGHEFFGVAVKRRYLPRQKIDSTANESSKTMILFSRLIADEGEVEDAFNHLETIAFANCEDIFSYGILIDLPKGESEHFSDDEEKIIKKCKQSYQELLRKYRSTVNEYKQPLDKSLCSLSEKSHGNKTQSQSKVKNSDSDSHYPSFASSSREESNYSQMGDRFNIFVRRRKKILGGTGYQGWEKKRGALLDLNRLILTNDASSFEIILGDSYDVKYIVALDSDTLLNSAYELVEIMEHPYNRATNVVSLSISTNPESASKTLFSRLMSGESGLASYLTQASDASFDVFGRGNYTGKGIYRVREFNESVCDKFRDNRILSHDFIEGAMAGCANASQKALDSFPSNFSSFTIRRLRWLRGDWQLLPYLLGKIKNKEGKRICNPISPIDKWHIFVNLIVSLIPIFSLALVAVSLFFTPNLLLLLLAFLLNVIYIINSLRVSTLRSPSSAVLEFLRQVYSIACLPVVAVYSLYSILVTLIRLKTGKRLLEWKVFAHSKGKINFLPNIIAAATIIIVAIISNLSPIFFAVGSVFAVAVPLDWLLSMDISKRKQKIDAKDKQILNMLANKTWKYFAVQLENQDLLLPADNYQEYLELGYAPRTSPTNIGMMLCAICCALELGFVSEDKASAYILCIVERLERMEKWRGCPYNWIDAKTLEPLYPKYVSTVDSGNLLVGLLMSLCYLGGDKLKKRILRLIEEMQLDAFFDARRGLFCIGYNETTKNMDKNHYDLMASESILTYLMAIGCGKIDKTAWNNLSRQQVRYSGRLLYSWTGGMFEYLMPALFLDYKSSTLLRVSAKNAIKSNIKYAKHLRHDFWGISESQYNATDDNGSYQYRAFGVPDIALANLADKRVFAPYSSILALDFFPKKVLKNIKKMMKAGMLGEYGFYEACDDGEIIKTYMTHHQGMILSAITGFLREGALIKKLRQSPEVRAAELLMTQPKISASAQKKLRPPKSISAYSCPSRHIEQSSFLPELNFLSGGKYNVLLDEYGKGYSIYDGVFLSRPDRREGISLFVEINPHKKSRRRFEEACTVKESVEALEEVCRQNKVDKESVDINSQNTDLFKDEQDKHEAGGEYIEPSHGVDRDEYEIIDLLDGLDTTHSFFSSTFSKTDKRISSTVRAFVLPNSGGEVREVVIKNTSDKQISIALTSFMEIGLATKADYIAHRAYSNMFVLSRHEAEEDFLLISRTNKKDYPYFAYYFDTRGATYSANRADFFDRGEPCANSFGHTLDTAASGRLEKTLRPLEELRVGIFCLASRDLDYLKRQVRITRAQGYIKRAAGECFSISKTLNPDIFSNRIAASLLYEAPSVDSSLLQIGLNIDIPLIVLEIKDELSLTRLKNRIDSLAKLYKFGIDFNLVLLYFEEIGYFRRLRDDIESLLDELSIRTRKNEKSTIIVLNECENDTAIISVLKNSALELDNIKNDFDENKAGSIARHDFVYNKGIPYPNAPLDKPSLELKMGFGGFLKDGSYFLDLSHNDTPCAWSNIIANKEFGTLITESGGGYTYHKNSRENKLTSWSNDALEDRPSESVILEENGLAWSITKKPLKTNSNYHVIHSFGYSEFINNYNGLISKQREYICENTKFFDISLQNMLGKNRSINIAAIMEIVLGVDLSQTSARLSFCRHENSICITNTQSGDVVYIGSNQKLCKEGSFGGVYNLAQSRFAISDDFVEAGGEFVCGGDLGEAVSFFDGRCSQKKSAVFSVKAVLEPYGSARIVFSLGADKTVDFSRCDDYLKNANDYYANLSSLSIATGKKELDFLLKWLPKQVLCSRFFARTGFYQAGGAKGFRDQLQDCLAVLYIDPSLAREHILDAAAHQFEEGDVQHWWHPPAVGVRTKISDDKLFLPFLTTEYIKFTGDREILLQRVSFLESISIPEHKSDIYAAFRPSSKSGTIFEHCMAAINSALSIGQNGLMLMGGGDWNDAMDLVGADGKGTTVWGSMFLYYVIERFLPLVEDLAERERLIMAQKGLSSAVERAWDGEWYLRAFTDDGRAIGSGKNSECKIDLITQAWARLSGIADAERADLALKNAAKHLVDEENKIIRLLWPPFKKSEGIGYICSYPEGVRENGGQYTHGAVWFIISLFEAGETELANRLLDMLNPINKSKKVEDALRYVVEPYVLAADVYAGQHSGRGGWTWYTGAAAWMYKCLIENLFGIKIQGDTLSILPNLPNEIACVSIKYKTEHGIVNIQIENKQANMSADNSKPNQFAKWTAQIQNQKLDPSNIKIIPSIMGKTIIIRRQ